MSTNFLVEKWTGFLRWIRLQWDKPEHDGATWRREDRAEALAKSARKPGNRLRRDARAG